MTGPRDGDDASGRRVVHHVSSTTPTDETWTDEAFRQAFRRFNRTMVVMWRLGFGRWAEVCPAIGGRMMVVEHVGRTSGTRYLTPLNFTHGSGSVYAVAAFGRRTDWYRNLQARPRTNIWLPSGAWSAEANDVGDVPERLDTIRRVLIDSGFAAPAAGLHPRSMSDEDLAHATSDYRLVRFDLVEPSPVPIDDLRWVGLAIVGIVAAGGVLGWIRRRR